MKLLTSEQQNELRALIGDLAGRVDNSDTQALYNQCIFWELELKPKRVRKKKDIEHDHLAQTIQEVYG